MAKVVKVDVIAKAATAATAEAVVWPSIQIPKERSDFKKLIISNPNYFGTFPELKTAPVLAMKVNTQYEELSCLGFFPDTDTLEAIVKTKLSYGYNGDLCSNGSMEYVRFFIDWNGDGTFDPKDDIGIASVNVHDIPETGYACVDKAKPLSYAVTLKINSKKKICAFPNMVKVRAILSWNLPPPAGNPSFNPPWGNVLDKWIQIKPLKLLLKDIVSVANIESLQVTPQMLDLDMEISITPALTVPQLKELYATQNIPEHRYNVAQIAQTAMQINMNPALMVPIKLDPNTVKLMETVTPVLAESSNSTYEELMCVGLNYDTDTFVATLRVKLPSGFSGSLCTKGSYEYVAFWAYVWDQIEQTCYWKHLGNTSVNVHDIKNIPGDGLQYAAYLTCDLSNYKDKCTKPKVLKVRGILSWNIPPPTTNPNYIPIWGNVVEAMVQLKPTSRPIVPGDQVPFISVVGGMAIESISGNPLSTVPSVLGDGYANGPSVSGGFSGLDSPFGGIVTMCGHISNPPNDPTDPNKLKYKVQYRKVGQPNWTDTTNTFRIWISQWDGFVWTMSYKDQVNTAGYYLYEEDLDPPIQRFVEGDVLAQWYTPVPDGDGLYEIRMLLYKPGALPILGVPADHVPSNTVRVMIDNTAPTAQISLDVGPCAKIKLGDTITGKITATDMHISEYSIAMEPSLPNMPVITPPAYESYPAMPAPGRTNWPFEIKTTTATTPCGYVIHLHVWDRTIVNNSRPGYYNGVTIGLCLLEK